ncbi:helix-turn-helix domain protein (plasmid) [Stanieria cyanosphaera PCC 7437]|uniref:Helix-turn-helix domain protein n=1 Tax=Stanieria cyanosphaera (strain ATCC 29371 / PCC 7437) TaxID=111780 RepID=K9Y1C0_STAC7|nr:helix-turn-helix transcriptional regulator [Stanieria cyanosphaera]AFZ38196.1 helix-turn-helix domain protein [Stanieria cyanosphaera PCC 7437]
MGHSDAKISNKRGKNKKYSHESSIKSQSNSQIYKKETRSPTEAQLCQNRFYEECPSSAITDTVYTAGVTGMDFWALRYNSLNGGKDFSSGRVELQIRDRFDLTDFAEVAYQTKEVIAHQFGEQTLKLHYALAAIAFRKPEAWKEEIKISASKLLSDFGEDKKKRRYIPKAERKINNKPTRYFSKEERLRQIAHHVYLLKRLEVWVKEWRIRSKGVFAIERSNLWEIYSVTDIIRDNTNSKSPLIDIEITYRPGLWFEKFAGHEYLREFGYLTSEALKLDPYQEKMALRLAYFALFALQSNSYRDYYQIETLLKHIGYENEIEIAKVERNIALNLKRSFDRGFKILANFEHPYSFVYDLNVPQWVLPDSKINKPKCWFDIWLKCNGTLQQPEITLERPTKSISVYSQENKKQKLAEEAATDENSLAFGKQIRQARKASGESLRSMAKELHISPSRLSQIENGCYPHPVDTELKIKLLTYLGI